MKTRIPLLTPSFVLLSLLILSLHSCGGGGGGASEDSPESLRFVNAITESDSIEITFAEENPVQFELEYGNSTEYFSSPEGDIPIRVREENSVVPALSDTQTIESGKAYTYLATKAGDEITGTLIEDTNDLTDNLSVQVRVVNAALGEEMIDLYVSFDDQSISKLDPTITAGEFVVPSDYVLFDSGSYKLTVTRTGSDKALVSESDIDLEGGNSYTVYLLEDKDGGSPFSILVLKHRS